MADFTNNLNLKKPSEDEFYSVGDFNKNADVIDKSIADLKLFKKYVNTGRRLVVECRGLWGNTEDKDTWPRLFCRNSSDKTYPWNFFASPYGIFDKVTKEWEFIVPKGYDEIQIFCDKKSSYLNWQMLSNSHIDFLKLPPVDFLPNVKIVEDVINGYFVLFNADTNKQVIFLQEEWDEQPQTMFAHYGSYTGAPLNKTHEKMKCLGFINRDLSDDEIVYYAVEVPEFDEKGNRIDDIYFSNYETTLWTIYLIVKKDVIWENPTAYLANTSETIKNGVPGNIPKMVLLETLPNGDRVYAYSFDIKEGYNFVKFLQDNISQGVRTDKLNLLLSNFVSGKNAFVIDGSKTGDYQNCTLVEYGDKPSVEKEYTIYLDVEESVYWPAPTAYLASADESIKNADSPGVQMKEVGIFENGKVRRYSYTFDITTGYDFVKFMQDGNTQRYTDKLPLFVSDYINGKNIFFINGSKTDNYYNCTMNCLETQPEIWRSDFYQLSHSNYKSQAVKVLYRDEKNMLSDFDGMLDRGFVKYLKRDQDNIIEAELSKLSNEITTLSNDVSVSLDVLREELYAKIDDVSASIGVLSEELYAEIDHVFGFIPEDLVFGSGQLIDALFYILNGSISYQYIKVGSKVKAKYSNAIPLAVSRNQYTNYVDIGLPFTSKVNKTIFATATANTSGPPVSITIKLSKGSDSATVRPTNTYQPLPDSGNADPLHTNYSFTTEVIYIGCS